MTHTSPPSLSPSFSRRGPGQEFVRITLEDVIEQLAVYDEPLEIDPLKVIF